MNKEAEQYHKQGIQLMQTERLTEALAFFSKAVQLDPDFPDPYYYRGEVYNQLGRIVEANADIQKAKALRSGKIKKKRKKTKRIKYDLGKVDSIYDELALDDDDASESVEFDTSIYDYVFSDDAIENPETLEELIEGTCGSVGCRAVLNLLSGGPEECFRTLLFSPSNNEVTLVYNDGEQKTLPLESFSSIRLSAVPDGCSVPGKPWQREIIETVDGNIHYQFVPEEQQAVNGLFTRSTKENTHLPYTFFPSASIRKRSLERHLGQILLEKRYISSQALKDGLEELQQLRTMKIGRIIARQARLNHSQVQSELEKAWSNSRKGLRTGEILADAGLIDEQQVLRALETQERMQTRKIGEFLVEKGILRELELYASLAEQLRIPFMDLRRQKVSKKVLTMLPPDLVIELQMLPVAMHDDVLVLAVSEPDPVSSKERIARHLPDKKVDFVLVQPTHLKNVINVLYKQRRG